MERALKLRLFLDCHIFKTILKHIFVGLWSNESSPPKKKPKLSEKKEKSEKKKESKNGKAEPEKKKAKKEKSGYVTKQPKTVNTEEKTDERKSGEDDVSKTVPDDSSGKYSYYFS